MRSVESPRLAEWPGMPRSCPPRTREPLDLGAEDGFPAERSKSTEVFYLGTRTSSQKGEIFSRSFREDSATR